MWATELRGPLFVQVHRKKRKRVELTKEERKRMEQDKVSKK